MSSIEKKSSNPTEAREWVKLIDQMFAGFNRSGQIEDMIIQFIESIGLMAEVDRAAVFRLSKDEGGRFQAEKSDFFDSDKYLESDEGLKQIKNLLLHSYATDSEFRKDISRISIDGESFFVVTIGELSLECFSVVWRFSESKYETQLVESTIGLVLAQVKNSVKWLQKLDRTEALIYRDDLTGLYNSRFLEDSLDKEIKRAGRFQSPFSLLFIDLDNFKTINDSFGHLTGSDILRQFGGLLRATLRDIDSIIRYGGDEFVIMLLGTGSSAAMMAADRIRKKVALYDFANLSARDSINITCSIGVASFPEHSQSKKDLMQMADECMYKSKNKGKNQVTLFSEI